MKKFTSLLIITLTTFSISTAITFDMFGKKKYKPERRSSTEFMHSGGAGFVSVADDFSSVSGWAAAYTPRYSMTTSRYSAIGVSSPTLFALSYSSFEGLSGVIDLPLMVEYSFGYGSTDKAYKKDFGMYLGAGAGVTLISGGYGYGGTFSNWNLGLGARMEVRDQPVDLRLTYGQGFGDWSSVSKFTLGLTYILSYA